MEELNTKKNLLLVGANGFIGKRLLKFLPKNLNIFKVSYSSSNETDLYFQIDCRNFYELEKLPTNEFHYIINLGGYIDHSPGLKGGISVFEDHVKILLNIINFIDRSKIVSFISIGTSDEYGDQQQPINSDIKADPISFYSLSKTTSYNLLKLLHKEDGFPFNFIRLFLTYGPGQNSPRLIPYVIEKCMNDEKFSILASNYYRDFCFVDDVCEGIIQSMFHNEFGNIFHIASGVRTNLKNLIEEIKNNIGTGHPQYHINNTGIKSLVADIDSTCSTINWQPRTSLTEGIHKTIAFYIKG